MAQVEGSGTVAVVGVKLPRWAAICSVAALQRQQTLHTKLARVVERHRRIGYHPTNHFRAFHTPAKTTEATARMATAMASSTANPQTSRRDGIVNFPPEAAASAGAYRVASHKRDPAFAHKHPEARLIAVSLVARHYRLEPPYALLRSCARRD